MPTRLDGFLKGNGNGRKYSITTTIKNNYACSDYNCWDSRNVVVD